MYRELFTEKEQRTYFVEFLLDGLLRGDIESRYNAYAIGKQWGFMSDNEIREKENMNPVPGGDQRYVPLNMIPVGMAGSERAFRMLVRIPESQLLPERTAYPSLTSQATINENRAMRSARHRHRLMKAQWRIFEDVAARILRREKNDVGVQARKMIGNQPITKFQQWLDEFYHEHSGFATRQMLPVFMAYGEAVTGAVQDEVGGDGFTAEIEDFVRQYAGIFGIRHANRSFAWLMETIQRSLENQENPLEAVEEKLDHWVENRAANVATEEATRENNAVARELYILAGITKIRSVAFGDSCPYCKALNGKVINIKHTFIAAGEQLQPEGVEQPLTASRDHFHSPYHQGCDCMNVAESGIF
jgi:hypothetical protein